MVSTNPSLRVLTSVLRRDQVIVGSGFALDAPDREYDALISIVVVRSERKNRQRAHYTAMKPIACRANMASWSRWQR
jgi:hypothetical protein